MSERTAVTDSIGFLPHEAQFIMRAVGLRRNALEDANQEYGEAVASSGGDWAFDDPASHVAAMEAHIKEKDLQEMLKLARELEDHGEISYPSPDEPSATYGSRVHLLEEDDEESIIELGTHSIPGIPTEEDVTVVSPSAPIAEQLHGVRKGEAISWAAPSGIQFSARVKAVDQLAVRLFFESQGSEAK